MSEQMVEGAGGKKGDRNGHIDEATECLGAEASAGGGKHFFFFFWLQPNGSHHT